MAEESGARWRNLQICEVEDAGTLWVREVPSQACSEELLQFLEMEKQMNDYFNNRQPCNFHHAFLITVHCSVVVYYKDCWRRGTVEKLPQGKKEKTSVFLVDYGFTCETSLTAVIPLGEREWASVPCQAKKVVLHGVVPISLQYGLKNEDYKLTLEQCKLWDPSATEYVKLLSSKEPRIEFTPVRFSQDGCPCGKLTIILSEEMWLPILPKVSQDKLLQTEDNQMALDLAQLLVDCKFAKLWEETEEEIYGLSSSECSQPHPNMRHTSNSVEAASNSPSIDSLRNVDTTAAHEAPGRLFYRSHLCITEGTSSDQGTELHSDQLTEAGNIEGVDQCDSELESHSSISSCEAQSVHIRIDAEEKSKLNYKNDFCHSSFTEVTNPLFRTLLPKNTTLAKDDVVSILRKSESHSSVLKEKEVPKDEVSREKSPGLDVQNQFMSDVSINNENSGYKQAVEHKDVKEASSLPERFGDCISARDASLSSLRHRWFNVPCWASRSLVGVMHHLENTRNKQNVTNRNSVQCDEKLFSEAVTTTNDKSPEVRRESLAAKIEHENTKALNTAIFTEESQLAYDVFFTVNPPDTLTKSCTCDLDEIYHKIIKQDCLHSTTSIVKTCRVFVAGESPVLAEEVMINRDIMSATLNPHILSVLSEKGMKATRLQAYTWPAINRGCSAVIVGEKLSGKTMGFVVPLLSLILDTYQHIGGRLPPGIGPMMVVVCSSWQSAKCAAEYVVKLLPANTTLKVMTAWGGCGSEEEINTSKQLLGGCDVLLTTVPCLLHLLTGGSTVWGGSTEGAATSLRRCCHLVFDDAGVVLEHFSVQVKEIITMWGKERKKCRPDLQLQVVVVSSRWTDLLGQLTDVLLPLLDPTIIISAPFEAAIATKVRNNFHWVDDDTESLSLVMSFIAASPSQKSMVFVKNDDVAALLSSMMKNNAVYCLVVNSTIHKIRLKELIGEWHVMQGVTMIVSEPAEKVLLHYDVSDAQAIFHTHFGSSWNTFTQRYGFMVDRFVFDVEEKSFGCESYTIMPKCSIERNPKIWGELNRICSKAAEEVKVHLLSTENGLVKDNSCLCCHLKSYGRCFDEASCTLRHDISVSDRAHGLPQAGKVTVDVISVVNASRFLVRLTEYQAKSDGQRIDLSNHYHILRLALQQYFADPVHCKPVQFAKKGMLCAVQDNGVWSRAQVVSVNYSKATCMLNVFLIDEGKEMIIQLSSAWELPSHFAAVPQLIVEVFLCCIQPKDHDREWTSQANSFVQEVFARDKKSKFVGAIILALGYTLWLNPLVEFSKIGNTYTQKRPLRGKLLIERYGMDNPNHIENLEKLCSVAGVPLRNEDSLSLSWIEARNEALQTMGTFVDSEDNESDTLTGGQTETDETINENKEECSDNVIHHEKDSMNVMPPSDTAKDCLPSTSKETNAGPGLSYERLPLNIEIAVEVTELVSAEEFYVVQLDKFQELDNLEGEIDNLHDYLESCENENRSDGKNVAPNPSIGSPCIAKFTDKYYRGQVKAAENDGTMTVFFVDHGETVKVPEWQVHACPSVWVEYMPCQAIRCSLAHITIPPYLSKAATQTMTQLLDVAGSWKVKALETKDKDGLLHVVELTDDTGNSSLEVWKHLIHQGVALMDSENVSGGEDEELFNTSDLDDQEIADFLCGLSAIKQLETEKKEMHFKHDGTTVDVKQKKSNSSYKSSTSESSSESDLVQENPSSISEGKEKESKDFHTADKKESDYRNCNGVNSEPDVNDKNTKEESCNLTKKHEEQFSCKEVKECLNLKEKDQDIHRTMTLNSQVLNMKRLGMPPLNAVDGVTQRLAPETSWSQKEDTVHITIHLVGVEQYKCRVSSTRLIFMSVLGDKFYVLDEELCQKISTLAESCVVSVQGVSVSITLNKAVKGKWISLFKDRRHRPWLRGQYQNLSSGDTSGTEDHDDDDWRKVMNKKPARGGLPAGISDSDGNADTDFSEFSE